MGILKVCIIILVLIYTIYAVDSFFLWIHGENVEENNERVYRYVLEEQKFCKDRKIIFKDNEINCKHKFITFRFICNGTKCYTENQNQIKD